MPAFHIVTTDNEYTVYPVEYNGELRYYMTRLADVSNRFLQAAAAKVKQKGGTLHFTYPTQDAADKGMKQLQYNLMRGAVRSTYITGPMDEMMPVVDKNISLKVMDDGNFMVRVVAAKLSHDTIDTIAMGKKVNPKQGDVKQQDSIFTPKKWY